MATKCIGNLKNVVSAARLAAAENNGRWTVVNEPEGYWYWDQLLVGGNYLDQQSSYCPGWNPKKYELGRSYGVTWLGYAKAPDNEGVIMQQLAPDGHVRVMTINLPVISRPASYVLLADSYSARPYLDGPQYSIIQGNGPYDEIHLRHQKRANVAFADGHIAPTDQTELANVGWNCAFDKKGELIRF